jgi:hypothetical protein
LQEDQDNVVALTYAPIPEGGYPEDGDDDEEEDDAMDKDALFPPNRLQ